MKTAGVSAGRFRYSLRLRGERRRIEKRPVTLDLGAMHQPTVPVARIARCIYGVVASA